MATYRVSNASQLNSAVKNSKNGDAIILKAGNYGTVSLNSVNKSITISSESANKPAVFSNLTLNKSANVKLDGLKFTGSRDGVTVRDSRNITIEDSDFSGNRKGISVNRADDITVRNNDFTGMRDDGMAFSGVDGLLVVGNTVRNMKTDGGAHHDMIQIHPTNGSSSNVTIRNNLLDSNDTSTQAIFIGSGTTHRNISIENNKITSGHVYGIKVSAKVNGLDIKGNSVLQDSAVKSSKPVNLPEISVSKSSTNVDITGNITHDIDAGGRVSNNKIVKAGAGGNGGYQDRSSNSDSGSRVPDNSSQGEGSFLFEGDSVRGWTKGVVRDLDFRSGDVIEFIDYDRGTLKDFSGGNWLKTSNDGTSALINSRADIKELIAASSKVKAIAEGNDTLVLRISQDEGTHAVRLVGIGDADYFL